MGTGFTGTFVISWSQTEVDGLAAAPLHSVAVGATWTWRGDAVRVDGPKDVVHLDGADGADALRLSAARIVHRLLGAALDRHPPDVPLETLDAPLTDNSFVVTDGLKSYTITVIGVTGGSALLMFVDEMPPRDRDLWVVQHSLGLVGQDQPADQTAGVICFTPGTWIDTPEGPRRIEELREGDKVQTRDNGAQEVLWIGSRRMTGARLFAMPRLRPVRIRAGALGIDRPEHSLLVSPEHRLLVAGDVARDLFNSDEVLVAAKDLINDETIAVDTHVREVTYVHLLLEQHEVLTANGVLTESFHPANTALSTLTDADRARLLCGYPELEFDPHRYGAYARRNLSASEAAILRHAA